MKQKKRKLDKNIDSHLEQFKKQEMIADALIVLVAVAVIGSIGYYIIIL